jgi:tryptophan synthase alpha chain
VPVVAGSASGRGQCQRHGRDADGVVVGSALVAVLEGADDTADAVARAQAFLAPLRQALDTAR